MGSVTKLVLQRFSTLFIATQAPPQARIMGPLQRLFLIFLGESQVQAQSRAILYPPISYDANMVGDFVSWCYHQPNCMWYPPGMHCVCYDK